MTGPSAVDGMSVIYVSFHIHPDDADGFFALVQKAIAIYGGDTEWVLERHQHNRFFLCPVQVVSAASWSGGFDNAASEIRARFPELERMAASDLILLADFIYQLYLKERK